MKDFRKIQIFSDIDNNHLSSDIDNKPYMRDFRNIQNLILFLLISFSVFFTGYYLGKRYFTFSYKLDPPKLIVKNEYPAYEEVDFSLFWEVWDLVNEDYLLRPVDHESMVYGAIEGMLASLDDPYTSFLRPEINKEMLESLNGIYQGIGAELSLKENQLIIVSPLDGSPAKKAGLRPGDKILAINEESTYGLSLEEAVLKIRGESGTPVTLKIQSATDNPRDVDIIRGVITISSVSWEDKGNGTAYIRVSRFGGETNSDWSKAVSEINKEMKELDAIIVDVRGNPGGYLQSAIYLAGEFYKDDVVVYTEDDLGNQEPLETTRKGKFNDIPSVFVLIDEGSASASEILAAALKDKINATLVGTKSFGKGTIQDAIDFEDGSGVHLTIAKWLTPGKNWVHENGIEPDVLIEFSDEDIENQFDAQLEKALELAEGY